MSESPLSPDYELSVREVLAAHFVMWQTIPDKGLPPGEWVCSCGLKFGFSDSAIDHVADRLAGERPLEQRVNNFRVQAESYWINRLICWHHQRYLRVLEASNGAEVYCDRCGRKRLGYTVIRPAPTTGREADDA